MNTIFSTNDVQPADRAAYWSDLVCDVFVQLECEFPAPDVFSGTLDCSAVSWLRLAASTSQAIRAERTPRQIAKDPDDNFLVVIQTSGQTCLTQDGHELVLTAGELAVCDTQRPYGLRLSNHNTSIWLQFPRRELIARVGDPASCLAAPHAVTHGTGALFAHLIHALPTRARELGGDSAPAVAGYALDLLALTLSTRCPAPRALTSSRAITLARLKRTIAQHLADPALTPQYAATLAGLHVRHANRLLSQESTSLERYITSERLARCHEDLRDPRFRTHTIGEIAYGWGFNDLSHFSRAFRSRYGTAPRDVRFMASRSA